MGERSKDKISNFGTLPAMAINGGKRIGRGEGYSPFPRQPGPARRKVKMQESIFQNTYRLTSEFLLAVLAYDQSVDLESIGWEPDFTMRQTLALRKVGEVKERMKDLARTGTDLLTTAIQLHVEMPTVELIAFHAGKIAESRDWLSVFKEEILALARAARAADAIDPEIDTPAVATSRRGRLPKAQSQALEMTVLSKASQTPGLLNDIPALAHLCGTTERTARRIIERDREKHARGQADKPDGG
jgi:hypothetical protein